MKQTRLFLLPAILLMLFHTAGSQVNLTGTWKNTVPEGEIVLEVADQSNLRINGQNFQYCLQGNVLHVAEEYGYSDYPFSLAGNELTIVFLNFNSGSTIQVEIHMQQDDGRITELMYKGKLYSASLCE